MSDNRRRMPSSAYLRAEMTEVNDTSSSGRHSGQLLNQFGICQSTACYPSWLILQASCDSVRTAADLFVGNVIGSCMEPLIYTAA